MQKTISLGFQKPDELKVTLATIMAKTINEEEIDLSKVILHHTVYIEKNPTAYGRNKIVINTTE